LVTVTRRARGPTPSPFSPDTTLFRSREGFAAKAERGNRLEIPEAGNLARGMPRQRQPEFPRSNAIAVVSYADQLAPTLLKIDRDGLSACIEAVLHQLLDD